MFNELWKGKNKEYSVWWCDLCDQAVISCDKCGGSTCNCHSCEYCQEDFNEFDKYKRNVENYLTKEEIKIYQKCLQIKKHILETIRGGEKEIDWKKLNKRGDLSKWECKMFLNNG
jgi:tRNA U54 and U55 pseudouridine synthase Pus10